MDPQTRSKGFSPQEQIISVLPAATAGVLLLAATVVMGLRDIPTENSVARAALLAYGILGSVYLVLFHLLYLPTQARKSTYAWMNAIVSGTALGALHRIVPESMSFLLGMLLVAAVISSATVAGRRPSYLLLVIASITAASLHRAAGQSTETWFYDLGVFTIGIVAIETIVQLRDLPRRQIRRLEAINEFSRSISSTLEMRRVLDLLSTTMRGTLEADTYFFGVKENDRLRFHLLYDDKEAFEDACVDLAGTLSGWVMEHDKGLFLPDLRREVKLPGVRQVLIGQERTSLSWMGVPVRSPNVMGVMGIASYKPHAFHEDDMELLSSMAGHAALALDNAARHASVEEQSLLDSLTGAYNHGHFLLLLAQMGTAAKQQGGCLSLIMLDIDRFKMYNDRYGHLAGDDVLTSLCAGIRKHLKRADAVGRWGGEEFAIALPMTRGEQAVVVAQRIRTTMASVRITSLREKTFPAPTISQGIAEFPSEADDVMRLVDVADHRLYVAKVRGRDQIEPPATHWSTVGKSRGSP